MINMVKVIVLIYSYFIPFALAGVTGGFPVTEIPEHTILSTSPPIPATSML